MEEAGYDCPKFQENENLAVPPGFVSLTSFILRKSGNVKKNDNSTAFPVASEQEPNCMKTELETNDIDAYRQGLIRRPWINMDPSNNHKPKESHTKHLPMNLPINPSRPKGTIRGCPSCNDCVKVTARWHPKDAIREDLEEAPIFHPTEEEFKDTLTYIASVRSKAETYGICRIVPPTCWKPPCFLQREHIWEKSEFVAQIQRIDGHQVRRIDGHQEIMASACENTKTKRKRDVEVALGSQLCKRNTSNPNNHNVEECDCESEPGPKFSLKTFKEYADVFKNQYFNYNDKKKFIGSSIKLAIPEQSEPSVENIEGEYGRIVQNPSEEIEVLCCNKLEAGVFSSGFPTVSDSVGANAYPEYLKSGWNLNNILSGSLLSFESPDVLCNLDPNVSVGMCFSAVNWKVEEHHLYSLSYIHLGEPKVWYSVPGRFAVNFETIWKKYLPDLHAGKHHMHDTMEMQLSCSILKAEVSFAPLEWLLHGQNVVELYREQRKKTLFSYDKLLLGAANEAVRAQWETGLCMKSTSSDSLTYKGAYIKNEFLRKAFNFRIQSEILKRKFLTSSLLSQRMDEKFYATCRRECSICLCDLHLSAVGCSCSNDKFACLDHAKHFCSCTWSNKIFFYRYEISELNVLRQALEGKLSAVFKWSKEYLGLTLNSAASKRSKARSENVSGSTFPSQDLHTKKSISQTAANESKEKLRQLQEILNASKKKQNEEVSQVSQTYGGTHSSYDTHSKTKTDLPQSSCASGAKGISSAGTKIDTEMVGSKVTISKKGDPKASKVSSVTNLRYLSFLQEHVLLDVSSDSTSTSSSDSEVA
ncbi:putative lysine-specific demethylase JMJ16 isoform X2 [Vigna umbellata]|uniref:putative lysine-specific demethylase JMJ16 isoform X2 n=1 Tax=Vigna umbellata TaxID=87088 RepID=UPI001F5E40A5|nr:putative lysine-specific demethylase JMJ16 isoform X2 [Vigna umbellata]